MIASDDHDIKVMNDVLTNLLSHTGKFCMERATWRGNFTREMFKKFLKIKIKNGELGSDKDEFGKVWYFRVEA
jgi:hypothetical protein